MIGRALIAVIRLYQRFLSPWMGRRCRFHPTCSAYAIEAIRSCGALKGGLKACWRILRCNPFNPGGYDPVKPDASSGGEIESAAHRSGK